MTNEIMRFLPYVLLVVLTIIPAMRLLKRTGMSQWWALFSFVPLGMIIILWITAYARWQPPVIQPKAN